MNRLLPVQKDVAKKTLKAMVPQKRATRRTRIISRIAIRMIRGENLLVRKGIKYYSQAFAAAGKGGGGAARVDGAAIGARNRRRTAYHDGERSRRVLRCQRGRSTPRLRAHCCGNIDQRHVLSAWPIPFRQGRCRTNGSMQDPQLPGCYATASPLMRQLAPPMLLR